MIKYSMDDRAMIGIRDDERISPAAISLITSANLFVIRTINRTRVTQPGTEKLLQYILTDYFIHNGYNLKNLMGPYLLVLMTISLHYNYGLLISLNGLYR